MELYLDCGEPRLTRRIVFVCQTARAVVALAFVAWSPAALALSLGAEQVESALGQPLRMIVPLLGSGGDALEARCFRVVSPSRADGLSVIMQARIELQTSSTPPLLIIRSNRAIDEPVVRIAIEAGCDAPIRRDYTILLDPPVVSLAESRVGSITPAQALPLVTERPQASSPLAATTATDKAAVGKERAATTGAARATVARQSSPPVASHRVKPAVPNAAREKSSTAISTTSQAQQDQLRVQASQPELASRVEDASLAALAVPRLRIASDLLLTDPERPPGTAVVDELQRAIAKDRRARLLAAPIESDLAPRLEADLVVAQRRLAELQSQLAAAGLVVKTNSPADAPASADGKGQGAATPAQSGGWNWRNWIWIPGLLLVAGLISFLLRQRRSQVPAQFIADESEASAHALAGDVAVARTAPIRSEPKGPPVLSEMAAALATVAVPSTTARAPGASTPIIATRDEREASDRLNNPLFQLRDTESHVDVTELSQVTDEAQVYADLGRNDQAIELLRDHIDAQRGELSSPAPWLMIFELYRRTNNRLGYDELAPQFRRHFNGRVPEWDNYGHELALDDGIEAFPHLVARIERDWGTGEARKFLEELLYDNRGGSRLGFSLAAYRDILLLLQVHEGLSAQPDFLASATDWESRGANDSDGTPKWDLSLEMIEPPKAGELESFFKPPPPDKS